MEEWKPYYNAILSKAIENVPTRTMAEQLGISVQTVNKVMKLDVFKNRLNDMSREVSVRVIEKVVHQLTTDTVKQARDIINAGAVEAAENLMSLVRCADNSDAVQLSACKDLLDRAGLKPIEIHETRERVYSPEEVVHAKETLLETEGIIKRLSNQVSPFVLLPTNGVTGSETEKAHAVQTESGSGT